MYIWTFYSRSKSFLIFATRLFPRSLPAPCNRQLRYETITPHGDVTASTTMVLEGTSLLLQPSSKFRSLHRLLLIWGELPQMAGYPSKLSIGHDPPRMPTTLHNTSVYVN